MTQARLVAVACAVLAGTACARAQVVNGFDFDEEGWTYYNDANQSWDGTVGNPPGSLKNVDRAQGTWHGFQASTAFLGDFSSYFGGTFEFQMMATGTSDGGPTQPDLTLSGGGLTLALDLPRPSNTVFSMRSVSLDLRSDWRVGSLSGAVATEPQVRQVLADVTQLRLRGEFISGADTSYLDNVRFLPPGFVYPPDIATVRLGKTASGSVESLATTDGDSLVVCKFIVPSLQVPPVSVELDGLLPFEPVQSFGFRAYARMATAGSFSQRLELWDWQAGQWDPVDTSEAVLDTNFAWQTVMASEPFDRFINAGAVRARYRVRQTGPAASSLWCHEADHMAWLAEPGV